MLRRRFVVLAVLLTGALGAPAFAGPGTQTTITGVAPYILGAEMRTVLHSDPALRPGGLDCWTGQLPTKDYGRLLSMPVGGRENAARLTVQFWRGRLAVVLVRWPSAAFASVDEWQRRAEDLDAQITRTYAREIIREHVSIGSAHSRLLDLIDAQGNELMMWSGVSRFDLQTVYLWGPYLDALRSTLPDIEY